MTEPRRLAPRGRLGQPDVPPQRRSGYAMRQEAARRFGRLAYEAETQDTELSQLAPLFTHLERLFSAHPASVPNHDMATLAALLLAEPPPATPEPITDGITIQGKPNR